MKGNSALGGLFLLLILWSIFSWVVENIGSILMVLAMVLAMVGVVLGLLWGLWYIIKQQVDAEKARRQAEADAKRAEEERARRQAEAEAAAKQAEKDERRRRECVATNRRYWADCYRDGSDGFPRDSAKANYWYKRAEDILEGGKWTSSDKKCLDKEMAEGESALFSGKPEEALRHFTRAATERRQGNPNYTEDSAFAHEVRGKFRSYLDLGLFGNLRSHGDDEEDFRQARLLRTGQSLGVRNVPRSVQNRKKNFW